MRMHSYSRRSDAYLIPPKKKLNYRLNMSPIFIGRSLILKVGYEMGPLDSN
jgi:hypothetical protein